MPDDVDLRAWQPASVPAGTQTPNLRRNFFWLFFRFHLTAFSRQVGAAWPRCEECPSDRLCGWQAARRRPAGQNFAAFRRSRPPNLTWRCAARPPTWSRSSAAGGGWTGWPNRRRTGGGTRPRSLRTWDDDDGMVVVHVDADALTDESDVPAGTSAGAVSGSKRVGGCPRVPAGTYRREAGDQVQATALPGACTKGPAGAVRRGDDARPARRTSAALSGESPGGEILNVGRKTRTISPALRRALAARDRQCRFPGCQNRRCDARHMWHWADGGATALDNLVLLCRSPHRTHKLFILKGVT